MIVRKAAIFLLVVAALALVAGALVGGGAGTVMYAFGVPVVPGALAVLAAPRRSRGAVATIVALTLVVEALLLSLALVPAGDRVAGLPAATWLMLSGLGALPLLVVPLLYAADGDGSDRPGSEAP